MGLLEILQFPQKEGVFVEVLKVLVLVFEEILFLLLFFVQLHGDCILPPLQFLIFLFVLDLSWPVAQAIIIESNSEIVHSGTIHQWLQFLRIVTLFFRFVGYALLLAAVFTGRSAAATSSSVPTAQRADDF